MSRIPIYILILIAGFACTKIVPFSASPSIEHISLDYRLDESGSNPKKLASLSFDVVDGDADIGRGDTVIDDTLQPGIHLWLQVPDSTGKLMQPEDTIFRYIYYQFPQGIEEEAVSGQIKAQIDISVSFYFASYFPFDTIGYRYYVVDKAGNKSNVLNTGSAYLQY